LNHRWMLGCIFLLICLYGFDYSYINTVKNGTMQGYETTTVGKAFDSSFDNPNWETFEGNKGEIVIQFSGNISEDLHIWVTEKARNDLKLKLSLGEYMFGMFQVALEEFGGPTSQFIQDLNKKYGCKLKNNMAHVSGLSGSFPKCLRKEKHRAAQPQERSEIQKDIETRTISYVNEAINALFNEAWKPGEPVTVQWIVHTNEETFELYNMDSVAWEGIDYKDIVEAIYNWQPSLNSPSKKIAQQPSDIANKKQASSLKDSEKQDVESPEIFEPEEKSDEPDTANVNKTVTDIKNSYAESCFSDGEAAQSLSDLKENWWTPDEQKILDIKYSRSLYIRKKDSEECIVLIESREKNRTCHACPVNIGIVIYSKSGYKWKKTYEQKNVATLGEFGKLPEAMVAKMGEDNFGIIFYNKTMAQGHYSESSILFAMVGGKVKKVFQVNTHYDNHGYVQGTDMEPSESNAEFQFIPIKNKEFYDIKVVTTDTNSNSDDSNTNILLTKTEIYKFDGSEYKLFEEKSNQTDITSAERLPAEELITFAENFIDTVNSTNIDELMSFYNDFVQFHGKNYRLQEIRLDKENYYKKWPSVSFNINGEIEIINKGNVAEVAIPVRYLVENSKRNEAVSGTAIEQLIVSQVEGKWKIIAESEKIIEQRTYSSKQPKTNKTVKNNPKNESTKTDDAQNTKESEAVDYNNQFNSNVNYYVNYLNGLSPNDRAASCSQYSTTSELNDFEKAAFKRACEIVLSNQAKPVPTQNPATYPRQQEEQQVDVNKVIDIIGDVIRRTY